MSITFNCQCGKVLSGKAEDIGRKGICPSCGRKLVVPSGSESNGLGEPVLREPGATEKLEDWLFAHQRTIWVGSLVLGIVVILSLAAFFVSRRIDAQSRRSDVDPLAPTVMDGHVNLDETADPGLWASDFHSFAAAVKLAIKDKKNLQEEFTGKEIRWTVTFNYLLERRALFFLEADPLRHSNRAISVWANLLPNEADKAERFRKGDKIIIQGKIGPVTSARSPANPLEEIRIGPIECTVWQAPAGN